MKDMKQSTQKGRMIIGKAAGGLVCTLFAFALFFLFLLCLFGETIVTGEEQVLFIHDSVWENLLILAIGLCLMIVLKLFGKKLFFVMPSDRFMKIITWVYIIGLLAFVMAVQVSPVMDQDSLMQCASKLLVGDYTPWMEGGYCFFNPHQNGMVLFLAAIGYFFGRNNWLIFQLLNILTLVGAAYFIGQTVYLISENKKLARYSYIALLCFFPIALYVTFVYGTLPGLCCASAGIWLVFRYLKGGRMRNAVLGVLFIAGSCEFKSNYQIVLIAVLLILLYDSIVKLHGRSLLLIVLALAFMIGMSHMANALIEKKTGITIGEGSPMISYVTMGMQEGPRAPGWYNDYNKQNFIKNGYDAEKASNAAKEELSQRLDTFSKNKLYALNFFSKKIASEWNEGTFQGFWVNMIMTRHVTWSRFLDSIMVNGSKINRLLVDLLNTYLLFYYLGILFFIIYDEKRFDIYHLVFAILFLGGFFFHLIWEAKGQYTIVYAYWMVPYMVRGYQLFLAECKEIWEHRKNRVAQRIISRPSNRWVAGMLVVICLVACLNVPVLANSVKLGGDEDAYAWYLEKEWDDLPDGAFHICSAADPNANLAQLSVAGTRYQLDTLYVQSQYIWLTQNTDETEYNMELNVDEEERKAGALLGVKKIKLETKSWTERQLYKKTSWAFRHVKDNIYIIKAAKNLALTYDPETQTVTLEKYTGAVNQQWTVDSVD